MTNEMKVLSNNNGSFLLENQSAEDEAIAYYEKQGWTFEDDGTRRLNCGDDCLYTDVREIGYDEAEDIQMLQVSYLLQVGGGRYEKIEQVGRFQGGELIGRFEDVE